MKEQINEIWNDKDNNIDIKDSYKKYQNIISYSNFYQIWNKNAWKHLINKYESGEDNE